MVTLHLRVLCSNAYKRFLGVSGLAFVQAALDQRKGQKLTLYVRSKNKVSAEVVAKTNVRVVEGSLTNYETLEDAMTGVDTVVSFLGAYMSFSAFVRRTRTTPIGDSFPVVFKAMRAQGIKRILALSTPSYYVETEEHSWAWWLYLCIPPLMVPQGSAEMVAIGKNVAAQTDFDWTVFRVPQLTNGDGDLPVFAGLIGPEYKGKRALSRASQARWVLQEIEERNWIKGAPALGNY